MALLDQPSVTCAIIQSLLPQPAIGFVCKPAYGCCSVYRTNLNNIAAVVLVVLRSVMSYPAYSLWAAGKDRYAVTLNRDVIPVLGFVSRSASNQKWNVESRKDAPQ